MIGNIGRVNNGETVLTVLGDNRGTRMVSSAVICDIFFVIHRQWSISSEEMIIRCENNTECNICVNNVWVGRQTDS